MRRRNDGTWEPDIYEVFEGQRFSIQVRHSHSAPIYVALLAFNMDQSIAPIYPPPGGIQRLTPGDKPLLLGHDGDRELKTGFPATRGSSCRSTASSERGRRSPIE